MIYFAYLLFLITMLTIERNSARLRPIIRVIIPIVYILLIGLRGTSIGTDTETYYEHFYIFGQWGCNFVEPGFDWINRIMFKWGFNANHFFIVNAAITMSFTYLALDRLKKKEYTYTAFCMYLLTFAFLVNGMRQGVACGIFIYANKFIEEKKPIKYILLLSFASLFHASSLILLPLYFLDKIRLTDKLYIGIFIFSFVGLFVNLSSYIPSIALLGRDYGSHVENMHVESASYLGFTITTLLNIVILALMLKNQIHKHRSSLFNLIFISFVLKNIGFSMPIIGRLTIYFSWFAYFIYPIILDKRSKPLFKSMDITRIVFISIHIALWINEILKLMPYKFYWE